MQIMEERQSVELNTAVHIQSYHVLKLSIKRFR